MCVQFLLTIEEVSSCTSLCSFEAGFLTEPGSEGGDSVFGVSCLCPAETQRWDDKCARLVT